MNADAIRKVKALLSKEGAGGTTPEEVATALALAQRIMEREGLTRAMLEIAGQVQEPEEDIRVFSDPLIGSFCYFVLR